VRRGAGTDVQKLTGPEGRRGENDDRGERQRPTGDAPKGRQPELATATATEGGAGGTSREAAGRLGRFPFSDTGRPLVCRAADPTGVILVSGRPLLAIERTSKSWLLDRCVGLAGGLNAGRRKVLRKKDRAAALLVLRLRVGTGLAKTGGGTGSVARGTSLTCTRGTGNACFLGEGRRAGLVGRSSSPLRNVFLRKAQGPVSARVLLTTMVSCSRWALLLYFRRKGSFLTPSPTSSLSPFQLAKGANAFTGSSVSTIE